MTQIRKLREAAGLTQQEVADRMKVALITVRKWEAGDRSPRMGKLKPLAKVLKCQPGELL